MGGVTHLPILENNMNPDYQFEIEQKKVEPVVAAVEVVEQPLTPEQEIVVKLMRQHSLANALRLHGKAVPR